MGVDPDGNAYAVCVDYRNGNWDIYFSHRQGQICAEEEFVRALGRLALLGSGLDRFVKLGHAAGTDHPGS